jgi:hypothetical protein
MSQLAQQRTTNAADGVAPPVPAEPDAMTILEFCRRHSISTPTYYKLRTDGLGPAEMRRGALVRITREAAAKWREDRSNPVGDEAAAVARSAAALRVRSRHAAKGAVASPNHVSKSRGAA